MNPQCNLCGGREFLAYRGRPAEKCERCGSKARHRVAMDVYRKHLAAGAQRKVARLLHLAPEACLHDHLAGWFGSGYVTGDAAPERYPHASALRLVLPGDLAIFPDRYFLHILHNHVLEHLPGQYQDHLTAFARLIEPGGSMIFSVPGPYLDRASEEGGEHFPTDAERRSKFLQEDHFKIFGADFVEFVKNMPGGELLADGVTDERRSEIGVRPGKAPFFIWRKNSAGLN